MNLLRIRQKRCFYGLLVLLGFLLVACGGGTEEEGSVEPTQAPEQEADTSESTDSSGDTSGDTEADSEEMAELDELCQGMDGTGLKVGFGNLGEQVPFAVQVREGIEKIADLCHLEVVNADNALDPQIAVDNANLFMTQQVDGIIQFNVHGNIAESICEIIGETPMIAIDIAHEGCSVFMGANNRQAGEIGGIAAGELAKEMWDCQVDAIVTHEAPGVGQVNIDRLNGQVAGLVSVCPDLDVGDFENWSMDPVGIITRLDSDRVDPGFEKGRDYLTANQGNEHIVALCINDDSCLGMLAAVQEAGREGQVIFSSQGADATSWTEIRNNPYWAGSVAYFPERYGELLVPNIIRLIKGEETEDPILMTHIAINKDNIDTWYPNDGTEPPRPAALEQGAADSDDVCQGEDGGGMRIGFGNLGEQVPFAVQVREGIEMVAAECGVEVVNADNALDPQIAVDNANLFMTQQVDGIIQFNVHGDIAESICGIIGDTPMIAIDIAHEGCSVFMGANNRRAGELGGIAAGELAKEMWDCQVDAIVTHEAPGVGQVNIDRLNGQVAGLVSVCPDIDVGDFENWSMDPVGIITRLDSDRVDPGFEKGRDYLTANQGAEHIVALCINDDSCLGMLAAVQEAGREGQVIFSSQGADATSWVEIRNNPYWAGSVAYFPERYGEFLIPNIIRMVNGDPVEDPILMEHISINAGNIDEWYPEE